MVTSFISVKNYYCPNLKKCYTENIYAYNEVKGEYNGAKEKNEV